VLRKHSETAVAVLPDQPNDGETIPIPDARGAYPRPEQQEGVNCVQPGNPCDAWP